MLHFLKKKPGLGIEITQSVVRVVALSCSRTETKIFFSTRAELPAGIVSEGYSNKNIHDAGSLKEAIRGCLKGKLSGERLRAGVSLPDGVFRVQTIEFDTLPKKACDQETLIRWRLEKTAAFDLADTLLRYQVLPREGTGFTVLASVAKKAVIAEYESILTGLGIEPWSIGISSFSTLNFYSPYIVKKSAQYALAHLTDDSFSTIVGESGGTRFYRFKDIKRGSNGEVRSRLIREIDDSLHFYMHTDRSQKVERLYLSGEPDIVDAVGGELAAGTSLAVEVLSPGAVLRTASPAGTEMAAALGAGRTL